MRHTPTTRRLVWRQDGSALVELALIAPVLMLLLCGVIDFGRAYYLAQGIAGAAHAGAEYGAQNPMDTAGMKSAAQIAAPNVTGLTIATPSYGCECANGTSYSASCSSTPTCSGSNPVYLVTVTASVSYVPWFPWPGLAHPIAMSTTAKMRSAD